MITCTVCGSDDRVRTGADGDALCKRHRVERGRELLEKDKREKGRPTT
jgi:hypothetical protein